MILRVFSMTLEPADPLQFSLAEFRAHLTKQLSAYMAAAPAPGPGEHRVHRYPALQCKQVRSELVLLGISQGAAFLRDLIRGNDAVAAGKNTCTILSRDTDVRSEEFGTGGAMHDYEFLTPWLALNQQYARKFYDLSGKPARDAFMERLLLTHLNTLAKSLDAPPAVPITCSAHVKFRRDRIDCENVIVFLGKFRTNLRIPEYFAIGQSVSQGYGTVHEIMPVPEPDLLEDRA